MWRPSTPPDKKATPRLGPAGTPQPVWDEVSIDGIGDGIPPQLAHQAWAVARPSINIGQGRPWIRILASPWIAARGKQAAKKASTQGSAFAECSGASLRISKMSS